MKESLDLLNENCRETVQRDPDNFNLHVYTDYWNYGVLDLVDNLVRGFQSGCSNSFYLLTILYSAKPLKSH